MTDRRRASGRPRGRLRPPGTPAKPLRRQGQLSRAGRRPPSRGSSAGSAPRLPRPRPPRRRTHLHRGPGGVARGRVGRVGGSRAAQHGDVQREQEQPQEQQQLGRQAHHPLEARGFRTRRGGRRGRRSWSPGARRHGSRLGPRRGPAPRARGAGAGRGGARLAGGAGAAAAAAAPQRSHGGAVQADCGANPGAPRRRRRRRRGAARDPGRAGGHPARRGQRGRRRGGRSRAPERTWAPQMWPRRRSWSGSGRQRSAGRRKRRRRRRRRMRRRASVAARSYLHAWLPRPCRPEPLTRRATSPPPCAPSGRGPRRPDAES